MKRDINTKLETTFFKYYFICWLSLFLIKNGNCQNYCDSSEIRVANIYFNQATASDLFYQPGAISLLKKSINADTSFAMAYFKLGELYHRKALLSQYDIKNQIHNKYYFRKASDNFLQAIALCDDVYNYLAFYYLGEQFFLQNEYSLSGYYLKTFLDNYNSTDMVYEKARQYYTKYEKWKGWHNNVKIIDFQPVAPINTSGDELNPFISANGRQLYFSQTRLKQKPNSIYNENISEIAFSVVNGIDTSENWTFDKPETLDVLKSVNTQNQYISCSPNNESVYFSDIKKTKDGNRYINLGNIFYSEISDDQWTTPELFNSGLNSPTTYIGQPCISGDGKTMYYVSNHPDGYGGTDIYYCIKDAFGKWGDPINMGDKINTINNEKEPFIHYDNSTFYFISDGHFGLGGYDLFITRKDEHGKWGTVENLGLPINSYGNDKGISVDARGIKAYSSSNKIIGKGGWDIYSFDLPNEFRPKEMILLGGKIIDQDSLPVVIQQVNIIDINTNEIFSIDFDENYSTFSSIIPVRNTNYYIKLNAKNYSFGNTYIYGNKGLHTYFETITLYSLKQGTKYYLKHVHFDNDFKLQFESESILNDFAMYLKKNNNLKINIIGTAPNNNINKCSVQDTEKAAKIYNYLIGKGISGSKLSYNKDTSVFINLPELNLTGSEIIIEVSDL